MENPFEYQDLDEPGFPVFFKPAPTVQHLLSLGLLLVGLFIVFVSLLPGARSVSVAGVTIGLAAVLVGYGLHHDRSWAAWGSLVFFLAILAVVADQLRVWKTWIYLWPAIGILMSGWLILNHRERHGR